MTKINLAEIEARASKATPGMWKWREYGYNFWLSSNCGAVVYSFGYDDGDSTVKVSDEDAEFIAHAREDVPALIKRLRKAEALLEEAQGYISESTEHQTYIDDKIDRYFFGGDE